MMKMEAMSIITQTTHNHRALNGRAPPAVHDLSAPGQPRMTVGVVGGKIHKLRKAQGKTLEQLAQVSGVSAGLLSQVERGRGNPSFSTLVQIAHGLGVSVARLVVEEQPASPVVRSRERLRLDPGSTGDLITAELLTPRLDSTLEVIRITTLPGYTSEATPFVHEGEEFFIVLEGTQAVTVDGVRYVLATGDSIAYSSHLPHWYENAGDVVSVSLSVITPPSF